MKQFKVTGVDRSLKRFVVETDNEFYAMMINVFRGSLWMNVEGKWKLLVRYNN
jgi:hypothetical protein